MPTRSSRAAGDGLCTAAEPDESGPVTDDPFERGTVVGVYFGMRDLVKTGAQQGYDVLPALALAVPEHLAHQSLGPVPPDCSAQATCRYDTEPVAVQAVRTTEQRQIPTPCPMAPLLNDQKLRTPTYPLTMGQRPIHSPRGVGNPAKYSLRNNLRRYGQPLAALPPTIPDHLASAPRLHSSTESMRAPAATVVRLISPFHGTSAPEPETGMLMNALAHCQTRPAPGTAS